MSNGPGRTIDHRRDLGGRLALHAGDHVGVLLERERRRLVAQPLADDLHRNAGLEGQGGVRVSEVVEPDPSQGVFLEQWVVDLRGFCPS